MKYHNFALLSFFLPPLLAFTLLAGLPANDKNAILWGYSKSYLLVGMSLFIIGIVSSFIAIISLANSQRIFLLLDKYLRSKNNWAVAFSISFSLFCLSYSFLEYPMKYLGKMGEIHERLTPLFILGVLTLLEFMVGLVIWRIFQTNQTDSKSKVKTISTIVILFIFILIWIFIAVSKLGINSSSSFWSKIGVPLLWPQIFFALLVGLGSNLLFGKTKLFKKGRAFLGLDFFVILLIWASAVLLWNGQNFVQGVFNTPPRPPSFEIFPINDSYIFDVASQKMLIGQKMINDVVDKPIYISFLAILHHLAGPSYTLFYLLQILVFASIPICGYLLGNSLHSRPFGILFSILLIIKETNAIDLTNYIHVSTSKMILSEMLTTLGILIFCIYFLNALKSQKVLSKELFISGGILGITSLCRLNSIGIFPIAILMLGGSHNFNIKRWIVSACMFSLFVSISSSPWMVRSFITSGDPLSFIKSKTSGVIVNQRYDPIIQSKPVSEPQITILRKYTDLGKNITTNYIHNLIGITLMMPPSLKLYNLLDTVKLPYWKLDWDGTLAPGGFLIISIVLILTSLGIASTWTSWRWAGLVPLASVLGYNLTTAISLTSGGRYLVPMDWGIMLYFSIGLYDISCWLLKQVIPAFTKQQICFNKANFTKEINIKPSILLYSLLFLFLGSVPLILESLPRKVYPELVTMSDLIQMNPSLEVLSKVKLEDLKANPKVTVFYGKSLYPRYYGENKGDDISLSADPLIGKTNFDRLSFLLIGGSKDIFVLLPTENIITEKIQGSNTWVVGCERKNYIEAIVIIIRQNKDTFTYWQNSQNLSCN